MVIKLAPACKSYIWGGSKLKTQYGKQSGENIIAETWELSCHGDGESIIVGGEYGGQSLSHYIARRGKDVLGTMCDDAENFPIMIKLIDAAQNLSVQVHPDNEYALKNENQFGKAEAWYILEAEPDAFIYYGFNREVSVEEFRAAVDSGTVCDMLEKVPVKKGDLFFIDAGTIHAIGAGTLLAEIQQSSNVTYRAYDYGRLGADNKPRELHMEKVCEVTNFAPFSKRNDFNGHLVSCDYFTVDRLEIGNTHSINVNETSFHALLVTEGEVTISCGKDSFAAKSGDCFFVDAASGEIVIEGSGEVLDTYLAPKEAGYRIGIDLGGTNIKAGIVNKNNEIISYYKCKTLVGRPWQEIVDDMARAARSALELAGIPISECSFVGVGSPGIIDAKTGEIIYSNNFGWSHIPMSATLSGLLGLPVRASNDANCAALGEFVAGAAKEGESTVLLTLGTGVGSGIVLNGRIFEGGPGGAEFGHTALFSGGADCTCGRKGCIEAYCSASALIRQAKDAARNNPHSMMNELCGADLDKMNGRIPFNAAKEGDAAAQQVVENYIGYISEAIIDLVNIFRPDSVLLSGGICGEGEYLTEKLNSMVRKYTFGGEKVAVPEVRIAALGNDAGIIGAANL